MPWECAPWLQEQLKACHARKREGSVSNSSGACFQFLEVHSLDAPTQSAILGCVSGHWGSVPDNIGLQGWQIATKIVFELVEDEAQESG